MKNQQGNAALFVLICLPLVLSFAILVVDVTRYQTLREQAQDLSDDLVLQAAKYLPNTEAANIFISNKISAQQEYVIENLEITSDNINLRIRTTLDSLFDVFLSVATGKQQVFEVSESASATIAPMDIVVLMPDGLTLRPKVKNYWGDWPSSRYFSLVAPPSNAEQEVSSSDVWPKWWQEFYEYGKWATQSCFNPVFSNVKSFIISLLDSYSVFTSTRVSVIAFPGDDPLLGYSVLRTTNSELLDNKLNYWEPENYLSDELCVLIANENDFYKTLAKSNCAELLANQTIKQLYFPRNVLSECVKQGALNAQEAVYYRAARKQLPTQQSLFAALQQGVAQIATGPTTAVIENRANLVGAAKKEIILLLDLPIINAEDLQNFWQQIGAAELEIRLTIVPFYASIDGKPALDAFATQLNDLNQPWLKVFNPVEPNNLLEKILPELMQTNQQILLKN